MKIVDSLEGSSLLIKGGSKTIENETKNKKEDSTNVVRHLMC